MNRRVEELIRFIRQNHSNCLDFTQMNNFEIYSILGNEIERLSPGKFSFILLGSIYLYLGIFDHADLASPPQSINQHSIPRHAQSTPNEEGNQNPVAFGLLYDLHVLQPADMSVDQAMAESGDSGNESSEDFDALLDQQLDQIQPDDAFPMMEDQ